MPGDPKLRTPGLDLAKATSSLTELAAIDGWTNRMFGAVAARITPEKSFTGSKGGSRATFGKIAWVLLVTSIRVYPLAGAFNMIPAARAPVPPGLLSTTTGSFQRALRP